MNKNKLINAIKVFCLTVVDALEESEQPAVFKSAKTIRPLVQKKAAYSATNNRDEILKYADKHGTHAAAIRFKVPVMRVAAYKAHRTMGTYR